MADSLDDFFAKKDKKRGQKNKNVLSAETLVRELEEGVKHVDFPSRKENKTSTAIELLGLDADDADWRDFEDVEKRDYTGLKVKEMSLQDQNEEEQRRLTSEQTEQLPESTPWKIKDEQTSSATAELASASAKNSKDIDSSAKSSDASKPVSSCSTDKSKTSDEEQQQQKSGESGQKEGSGSTQTGDKEQSAKPQKYVPPSQRGLGSGEVKILEPMKLSKTKMSGSGHGHASIPDIQDEHLFPSLG